MQLTTPVTIKPASTPINNDSQLIFIGSCFAQNIGEKCIYYGFPTLINPMGILFNPVSIARIFERVRDERWYQSTDVETPFCYEVHSQMNHEDETQLLENLNHQLKQLKKQLSNTSHLFVTLGTAWVYKHKESKKIVANCHKQPQYIFEKLLLSMQEINQALDTIEQVAKTHNPNVKIIYTVSPVRHTRDGMVENTRSKSRLHEGVLEHVSNDVSYFPAYEIVLDELRDYRFFKSDMIHLNEVGIEYVWSRFRESVIDTKLDQQMSIVEKFRRLEAHKPQNKLKHEEMVKEMKDKVISLYPKVQLK